VQRRVRRQVDRQRSQPSGRNSDLLADREQEAEMTTHSGCDSRGCSAEARSSDAQVKNAVLPGAAPVCARRAAVQRVEVVRDAAPVVASGNSKIRRSTTQPGSAIARSISRSTRLVQSSDAACVARPAGRAARR
jgi:hypothetical protein